MGHAEDVRRTSLALLIVTLLVVAACGADDTEPPPTTRGESAVSTDAGDPSTDDHARGAASESEVPEVVNVIVTPEDGGTYRFDVTVSSPYDRPDRYADAWRVAGPDGTVLGIRELTHDHADEQPFTRSLEGVEIPADVGTVTIEARDLVDGWSGNYFAVEVSG